MYYDLCVLTSDYHAEMTSAINTAIAGMRTLCAVLKELVCGVLDNNDNFRLLLELEGMKITPALKQCEVLLDS